MATSSKRRRELQNDKSDQDAVDSTDASGHRTHPCSSDLEAFPRQISLELPSNTGCWKQEHLEHIGVQVDLNVQLDPLHLVSRYSEKLLGKRYTEIKRRSMLRPLTYIQETVIQLMAAIKLNEHNISDIEQAIFDERQDLISFTKNEIEEWRETSLKKTDSDELKTIIHLTYTQAINFVEQLEYIVSYSKNITSPREGMFQQLFLDFLKIFHIKAFGQPNIEEASLQIGDSVNVSSTADILVVHPGEPEKSLLTVIKVNGQTHQDDVGRRPVSAELISQHSADLLSYLSQSLFGHSGLFGIIVQGSKVCFTVLETEKGYYEQLLTTRLLKKNAKIHISRELNILSRQDRESLILPLLEFLHIQYSYCEYTYF